jgi:hypothetical protein
MFAVKERIMVCLMSDKTAYVSGEFKIDIHSVTPDRISRAVALMAVIGPRLASVRLRHRAFVDVCMSDGILVKCGRDGNGVTYAMMLDGTAHREVSEGNDTWFVEVADDEIGLEPHPTSVDQCEVEMDDDPVELGKRTHEPQRLMGIDPDRIIMDFRYHDYRIARD